MFSLRELFGSSTTSFRQCPGCRQPTDGEGLCPVCWSGLMPRLGAEPEPPRPPRNPNRPPKEPPIPGTGGSRGRH